MTNYEQMLETVRGLSEGRLIRDPEAHLKRAKSAKRYSRLIHYYIDTVSELKVKAFDRNEHGMILLEWPSGRVTEISQRELDERFKETTP